MVRVRHHDERQLVAGRPRIIPEAGGRVCGDVGCDTVLSRYNHSGRCAVHDGWMEPLPMTHRRSPDT